MDIYIDYINVSFFPFSKFCDKTRFLIFTKLMYKILKYTLYCSNTYPRSRYRRMYTYMCALRTLINWNTIV